MTGVIATLVAVAVIATLMVIGIRMKLPPPDPDWREHLPPPPPPTPSRWGTLWLVRTGVLILVLLASVAGWKVRAGVFGVTYLMLVLVQLFFQTRRSAQYRRELKRLEATRGDEG